MTKETMLDIIDKHNAVLALIATETTGLHTAPSVLLLQPQLISKMKALSFVLTRGARQTGIDAKCNIQSGEITMHGDIIAGE